MRRSTALVLVVLGAALAGFVFSSTAVQRDDDEPPATTPSVAAGPQSEQLDWRETFGPAGRQLVFEVERIQVLADGWKVWLGLKNMTPISYEVGDPRATIDRSFGLMLFDTGDVDEVQRRSRNGTLPTTRAATSYEPSLPRILEPNASWRGTISAHGALVAGSYARVVFGTLSAVGATDDDELAGELDWITDRSYRLKR